MYFEDHLRSFTSLFIIFIFIFSFLSTVDGCDCAVRSECYYGACVEGECVYREITPPPPGCCETSNQCTNGTVGGTSCITPHCFTDYYACANIWHCPTYFPPPPEITCTATNDCAYLTNYCVDPVCVNNTCVLQPIKNPGCCEQTRDCMDVPCMNTHCDLSLHYCVYTEIPNCVYNSITPSFTSTSSLTATSTATSTMTSTSTSTSSLSSTPSLTPTPSSTNTASTTSTSTATSTRTSTSTKTATPSITPTNTGTSTSTSTATATPSASFSVSPSLSPEPSEQPPEGSSEGNSWIYILMLSFGAIAIAVGVVIIIAVIIYLRKKYIYTRLQPDDFIDDEEFPM